MYKPWNTNTSPSIVDDKLIWALEFLIDLQTVFIEVEFRDGTHTSGTIVGVDMENKTVTTRDVPTINYVKERDRAEETFNLSEVYRLTICPVSEEQGTVENYS